MEHSVQIDSQVGFIAIIHTAQSRISVADIYWPRSGYGLLLFEASGVSMRLKRGDASG